MAGRPPRAARGPGLHPRGRIVVMHPLEAGQAAAQEGPRDVPHEERFNPARMKSAQVVPVTRVEHFRYPVLDAHSHAYAKDTETIASWVRLMDQVGIRTSLILRGPRGRSSGP